MNTKFRIKAKHDFEKDFFFKFVNNAVFGKIIENIAKHRCIRLAKTNNRRGYLVSQLNYHTTKWFTENLSVIEINKAKVKTNKPIFFRLPILEFWKRVTHEFWYNYIKPRQSRSMLHDFIVSVKTVYMFIKIFIKTLKNLERNFKTFDTLVTGPEL